MSKVKIFCGIITLLLNANTMHAQVITNFGLCICPVCIFGYNKTYTIPSGSMAPTINTGDCIVTIAVEDEAKFDLKRGSVVVFKHPVGKKDFVGRIIGLEGDTVQIKNGRVILNEIELNQVQLKDHEQIMQRNKANTLPRCKNAPVPVGSVCLKEKLLETLPNGTSYEILNIGLSTGDETGVYNVPNGHFFALGDNRDNAADSRYPLEYGGWGYIPIKNINWVYVE